MMKIVIVGGGMVGMTLAHLLQYSELEALCAQSSSDSRRQESFALNHQIVQHLIRALNAVSVGGPDRVLIVSNLAHSTHLPG